MKSFCSLACAAALGVVVPVSPAEATTTLGAADYPGGAVSSYGGDFTLAPGRYRINLAFSQSVDDVYGGVEETYTYNDFCDFGDGGGAEYCGGDDDPILPLFARVSPTLYSLNVTVGAPSTTFYPPGSIVVREDSYYTCCSYNFDVTSGAAGHFTLSYMAVPEPGTWLMMLLGFGAIGFAARRRQVKSLLATS